MLRLCCGVSHWDALLKLSSCSALHGGCCSQWQTCTAAVACLPWGAWPRSRTAGGTRRALSWGGAWVCGCVGAFLQRFFLLCLAAPKGLQAGRQASVALWLGSLQWRALVCSSRLLSVCGCLAAADGSGQCSPVHRFLWVVDAVGCCHCIHLCASIWCTARVLSHSSVCEPANWRMGIELCNKDIAKRGWQRCCLVLLTSALPSLAQHAPSFCCAAALCSHI